jgi:hypothetical protein
MRCELADVNDEVRAAGAQREGHHRHIRLAMVQRTERGHLLGAQQVAEGLGVSVVHRLGAGASTLVLDVPSLLNVFDLNLPWVFTKHPPRGLHTARSGRSLLRVPLMHLDRRLALVILADYVFLLETLEQREVSVSVRDFWLVTTDLSQTWVVAV